MIRLFLDCEWADLAGRELVSLALVSEDGSHRFYAEVDPLPSNPTDFVREVVYPLLEGGASALPLEAFAHELRSFLNALPEPRFVLHDYHNDAVLIEQVLRGCGQEGRDGHAQIPTISCGLFPPGELRAQVHANFEANPEVAKRRHHAAVDAEALRRAFCAAVYGDALGC